MREKERERGRKSRLLKRKNSSVVKVERELRVVTGGKRNDGLIRT